MNGYVVSMAARKDLRDIWVYPAEDNPEMADAVLSRFRQAMELLGQHSELGRIRTDLGSKPLRSWPVGRYLLLYRVSGQQVEVIAILHGARNLRAVLRSR